MQHYSHTHKDPNDRLMQEALKASGEIPTHIAIIMDGNGRWAKNRGQMRVSGHNAGIESVRDTVEACAELGVKFLTLYAFSKENWKRPQQEVLALMQLLIQALRKETKTLHDNDIRLNAIGNVMDLPPSVRKELTEAMDLTKNNKRMVLSLALSYSGRWEIMQATRRIAEAVRRGELKPEDITDEVFEKHLTTYGMPHPDLLIRTSGEFRISNFLLWQLAYTEIHITDCYWPDFRRQKLYEAIIDFQRRERRFGMTSEQLAALNTNTRVPMIPAATST
ncbi:MAG: isoprenyl transferase [Candidatus Thermochlorobacter aerophilum]|jgi:undecaprenyl diphosphate synthase|uniref:Isoprenyl transferase n=1 Tax=Candidatus Thermochlorobacter aerophilus TaxID=1868324 RepID=A0A395LYM1_9BACT|nr:MAG: isoprenyl transferase [Candidatus Thermochlorobacter aerophilum]